MNNKSIYQSIYQKLKTEKDAYFMNNNFILEKMGHLL